MYLYYQKLGDVTEFIISRNGRDNSNIYSGIYPSMKKNVDFVMFTLKQVPIQNRMYDDKTHIWSMIGTAGAVLIAHLESFITQGLLKGFKLVEITDDLHARLEAKRLDKPLRKQEEELKFKEEDFFHYTPAQESVMSRDEVISKLEVLLDCGVKSQSDSELKRLYRKAALKYHPDRNNGDGSKMSELNMLWNIFNQGVTK